MVLVVEEEIKNKTSRERLTIERGWSIFRSKSKGGRKDTGGGTPIVKIYNSPIYSKKRPIIPIG